MMEMMNLKIRNLKKKAENIMKCKECGRGSERVQKNTEK